MRARRKRLDEAAAWVLRNREAGQGAGNSREFQEWLDRDPDNAATYQAAERLMGEARMAIQGEPALRDFKMKRRRPVAKAATLSIFAALIGGAFLWLDGPMRLRADAMSGTDMPVITLADGSIVQLNASSAVAYHFTASARVVRLLRGQAFFQVAEDTSRPFVVEARGGRTTALGTAFNVRIGEDATDVTVAEHAVSITPEAGLPAIRVGEGQQATYEPSGAIRAVRAADVDAVLAWRRGQLVVDNATLAEVVAEIGRHFAGRIVIASSELAHRRVSGTFTVTDVDTALMLLRESLGVSVVRIGPVIVLRG